MWWGPVICGQCRSISNYWDNTHIIVVVTFSMATTGIEALY